jgi:hypothetical protein
MSGEARKVRTLDVRPLMARGEEPFAKIMALVRDTSPGDAFIIVSPFIPAPLIERLQSEGYVTRPEHRSDGAWQTHFSLPARKPSP